MKIVHVVSSLKIGGAERFVADLGKQQIRQGHEITIITFGSKDEPLVGVCNSRNLNIVFLEGNAIKRNLTFHRIARKSDVIHLHTPHVLKALLPALWMQYAPRIIYTRHGAMSMNATLWRRLHKIAKHIVHEVSFVSEEASEIFSSEQRWHYKKHHVIENGFDFDGVVNQKVSSSKLRLGSVGRMVALKGQKTLLNAVSKLDKDLRNKISVNFYGDGDELAELEMLAKDKCSDIDVIFHGIVTNRDKIYNNIDLLIVTSETEGLSLAMIEAMAYNTPVIATDVGGSPRLAINDKTGYLFDYKDESKLADIITKYIGDDELITSHGVNAEDHVRSNFSLEATINLYDDIYA